jgi:hypothetical protein
MDIAAMAKEDAVSRLARQIDAAKKAERFHADPEEIANLCRDGASEMHRICAEFVASVNGNLPEPLMELSPGTYTPEMFQSSGVNLIQISSQGRQMQIAFETPAELISTNKFLIPYVLDGEIRTYNQRMLERFEIRNLLVFFCIDNGKAGWRCFDWRTRHTGPVDRELLARLMEPLF